MIQNLLHRLEKVRSRGHGRWMASCPCHTDKHPSLSIKDSNGTILLKCFSQGCPANEICDAVGFNISDLFPHLDNFDASKAKRRAYQDADQVLAALAQESLVILVTASDMVSKRNLSEADYTRLSEAVMRVKAATEYTRRVFK